MYKIEDLSTTFKLNRGDIEEVLLNLKELAAIPAPPLNEGTRRDKFLQILKKDRVEGYYVDDFGNVLIPLNKTPEDSTILISTNLDSAFDSSIKHGVLFSSDKAMGPGVGENVIALSALPILYKYLKEHESKINFNILLAATTGGLGNGDFFGMRGLIKKIGQNISQVISLRGTDLGKVGYQSPAISREIVTVRTENLRKEGITWSNNPITILSAFMKELHELQKDYTGINQIKVSFIRGGNDFDGVPSIGSLGIELIAEEENALFGIENTMVTKLNSLVKEETRYTIESISSVLPGGIDKSSSVIQEIRNIYSWISKNDHVPIKLQLGYSTSESSIPMSQDIPTLELGITTGRNNRYLDDYIFIKPIPSGIKQILFLIWYLNNQ